MHVIKRYKYSRLDVLGMLEVTIGIMTSHMMEAFNNKRFWVISGLKNNVISFYVTLYFAEELLKQIVVRDIGW